MAVIVPALWSASAGRKPVTTARISHPAIPAGDLSFRASLRPFARLVTVALRPPESGLLDLPQAFLAIAIVLRALSRERVTWSAIVEPGLGSLRESGVLDKIFESDARQLARAIDRGFRKGKTKCVEAIAAIDRAVDRMLSVSAVETAERPSPRFITNGVKWDLHCGRESSRRSEGEW